MADKIIRNSFEQELIDNKYTIFKSHYNGALRGFQKCIRDEKGKKYFISIWHYNHAEQSTRDDVPNKDSYQAHSQFTFKDSTCNIEYWGDVLPNDYREVITLKDIEGFFEKFWINMNPDYYEEYE